MYHTVVTLDSVIAMFSTCCKKFGPFLLLDLIEDGGKSCWVQDSHRSPQCTVCMPFSVLFNKSISNID